MDGDKFANHFSDAKFTLGCFHAFCFILIFSDEDSYQIQLFK